MKLKNLDDLIPQKNSKVLERKGPELLLFDSNKGILYEVLGAGEEIWELCNGKHTVGEIKKILKDRYGELDEIDKNVTEFISKLVKLNLISLTGKQ